MPDYDFLEDREILAKHAMEAAQSIEAAAGADDDILAYVGYAIVEAKAAADGTPTAAFDPMTITAIIKMIMDLIASCRDPAKQMKRLRKHPKGLLSWPARSAAKQAFRNDEATKADAGGWTDAAVTALAQADEERIERLVAKVKR
jgi:hypothetical protein